MRALRLGKAAVGLGLHRMDQVGELDRVLDEEDGDIVADQIPIALPGVEFYGKAAHVAGDIGGALAPGHGGKAAEQRRLFADPLEDVGARQFRDGLGQLEMAVDAIAARMDDAFRDPLMIEMKDFLAHDLVFDQGPAAGMALQAILVVGYRNPLLGGHDIVLAGCSLARLAIFAELQIFHGYLLPWGCAVPKSTQPAREGSQPHPISWLALQRRPEPSGVVTRTENHNFWSSQRTMVKREFNPAWEQSRYAVP